MTDLLCLHEHGLATRQFGEWARCIDCGEVAVWCCACGKHGWRDLSNGICSDCQALIRRGNHSIVAENLRLREQNALLWQLVMVLTRVR